MLRAGSDGNMGRGEAYLPVCCIFRGVYQIGWKLVDGSLYLQVLTHQQHASLLEIVNCYCKSDCGSNRWSCKNNMEWIARLHVVPVEEIRILPHQDLGENDE